MKKSKKFFLTCCACEQEISDFGVWFSHGQRCPKCGSGRADAIYTRSMEGLKKLLTPYIKGRSGLWHYFDYLPINSEKNIISCGEGTVSIDRWKWLERLAREKYKIDCRIYAHRHDNNFATGTFKDLAGSMVASVLNENNIKSYVVASTGNVGVAYARYLTEAGISLSAFIPENSSPSQEAEIGCFGQRVFRVIGDYARAKELAREFAAKYSILLAAGNFDPMRIEAKKTMVYEWLRLMPEFPTVYVQALSGGTGPLGIDKALNELQGLNLFENGPRYLLVQTDKCSPMADAWAEAKAEGFPEGWENKYPIYQNPVTSIPTLATGYPVTYPVLSKLVRKSEGEIIAFPEKYAVDVARLVAYEVAVRIGPAAAVPVGGFILSLARGLIRNGDVVMLNVGEGIRRAPAFMKKLIYTTSNVSEIDDCEVLDRATLREKLWKVMEDLSDE